MIEYPELKGTYKNHQLLDPHRSIQKLDHVSGIIFQMLLELQQVQCHYHFPVELVPVPSHPLSEEPFPNTHPESPLSEQNAVPLGPNWHIVPMHMTCRALKSRFSKTKLFLTVH